MRRGAAISGAMHGGLILAVTLAPYVASDPAPAALSFTEVTVVDGSVFGPASGAPVEPSPAPDTAPAPLAPAEPAPASAPDRAPVPPVAEAAPERPEPLGLADPAADPELPVADTPPPPAPVPGEAIRPSIAEIASPDPVARLAPVPESPPTTEPLQPLASADAPLPGAQPQRPPEPEPEPSATPAPEAPEPEAEDVAETPAEPDADLGPAPRQARIPFARPADLAAASQAAAAARQAAAESPPEAAAEPQETSRPQSAGGTGSALGARPSRFANQVTRGERDALVIGLKRYFTYAGNRADPSLSVTIGIGLDPSGRIVEGPELLRATGTNPGAQQALSLAAQRALRRAASAGEFARLPIQKYDAWKVIHVTFTPAEIGFAS